MGEWKTTELRKSLLEVAIEAAGEQIRCGVAEADIDYDQGVVRATLRREPFSVNNTEDHS